MKDKMTSGEIAKKTGLSQKAIRLYDEKGLLKPAEYSEGNYRLYDKESLLVLEKIIALKQVGFSLEEIRENLNQGNEADVCESLNQQIQILEEKKHQLELSIECIRWALERCANKTDWESIAEIMRAIQINQGANERYLYYQSRKDEAHDEDWYAIIMRSLELRANEKVLDLGCGYGLLWRNNWHNLPENMVVYAVDIPGSHGADFAAYIEEHKAELPVGTEIIFDWQDVEDDAAWPIFAKNGPYNHVIAHYLFQFLQNKELFLARIAGILAENGVFCCNGPGISRELYFWKEILEKLNIEPDFVVARIENDKGKMEAFSVMLGKYFGRVEGIALSNRMHYTTVVDLYERMINFFPEQRKYLMRYERKIVDYLEERLAEHGEIVIEISASMFWHCYRS